MNIIIDLIRKGNEHHVFNFETIKALSELDFESVYFLEKDSSAIQAVTDGKEIKKINIKGGKFYFWFESTINLLKIFFLYRKKQAKFILLSATPLQYYLCVLISRLYNLDINIFMHGELGYISTPKGIGQKIGRYFILKAFNSKSTVKFVSLSEYIYSKLSGIYSKTIFSFIEHPLQEVDHVKQTSNSELQIGSFGIHSKDKSSLEIYSLAQSLLDLDVSNIRLVTVGVSNGTFEFDKHSNVNHLCRGFLNESLIPKEEFMAHVKGLDFALFFSGSDQQYDLIPSGVFSDCIALELPIISLANAKMEYFFNKHGDIGIICEDINDMAVKIANLSANPSEISKFKKAIKIVKQNFSREAYRISLYRVFYAKS